MTTTTAPAHPPRRRIAVAAAGAVVAVLALAAPARAQASDHEPITWGIRPSTATGPDGRNAFDFDLAPGDVVDDHVGVSNFTDQPIELDVYATDAFTSPDGHFDLLPAAERPADVGAWVAFAEPTVIVPPRSRLDIPFRLTVPDRASPGDHPGGIVASLRTTTTDGSGNPFTVDRRVGARIHLRVEGELAPDATVTDVSVRYDGSLNPLATGEATVRYTITNTGNTRIAGEPSIEVAGPFGLASQSIDGSAFTELLPGDALDFDVVVPSVPPLLRLDASVRFTPQPVVGEAFDADGVVSRAAAAWAVPWSQALVVVAVLLFALAWRQHRSRHRARLAARIEAAHAAGRAEALGTA